MMWKNLRPAAAACAVAACACFAAQGGAGPDYQISIPAGGDLNGNFYTFQYLGPSVGQITNGTFQVTFTTLGSFNAADLDIFLLAPVIAPDGFVGVSYAVSGAELGWNGQGTFTATIDLPDFEAELGHPSGYHTGIWTLDIGDFDVKPPQFFGAFTQSSFSFDITADPCAADIKPFPGGDNVVDTNDLLEVIGHWGECPQCAADINADDLVNVNDLLAVIGAWGGCP